MNLNGNSVYQLLRGLTLVLVAVGLMAMGHIYGERVEANPPVDGQCGPSLNSCDMGDYGHLDDAPDAYLWQCLGENGGSDVTCTTCKPSEVDADPSVSGSCGMGLNACETGYYRNEPDTPEHYMWQCRGIEDGVDASCSYPRALGAEPPITGRCGSRLNACDAGDRGVISSTDDEYTWTCLGEYGGLDATCSRPKTTSIVAVPPPECGPTPNVCELGEASPLLSTHEDYYMWQCRNGGHPVATCHKRKSAPIDPTAPPQCSSVRHNCEIGEAVPLASTEEEYRWKCTSESAHPDVTCSALKPTATPQNPAPTRVAQFSLPDFPAPGNLMTVLIAVSGSEYRIVDVKLIDLSHVLSPLVLDTFVCDGSSALCDHVFKTVTPMKIE